MSKRTRSQNPSPSKTKRTRMQPLTGQSQIDHFFQSPKYNISQAHDSLSSPGSSYKGSKSIPHPEIIDVDSLGETDSLPGPSKIEPNSPPIQVAEWNKVEFRLSTTDISRMKSPSEYQPLDIDPIFYDPESQPSRSTHAPYSLLAHALVSLSDTRSRVTIINILTNVIRTIIAKYSSSLLPAIYLLSNSLGPQFVAIELGLGSSVISRSIQQISGLSAAALKRLYNSTGDPGDVAFAAKSNVRTLIPHPPLSITYVFESLLTIARCKGQGAAKEKQKIVEKLLLAASGEEVRYLTRTLCQNLRVGAVRTSILIGLARAIALTPPTIPSDSAALYVPPALLAELRQTSPAKKKHLDPKNEKLSSIYKQSEGLIKKVYVKHPSYDQIIPALLENGFDSLAERVPLTVGIPLLPMLGSPTRSLSEIYHRLGELPFSAEFKYDGQRAQIHATHHPERKPNIKLFSRHLEDMTSKYPDVINLITAMFASSPSLRSFIMDAEIVAIDPASGTLKSFQELSGRARKDVDVKDIRISVCVYAFDLMYLNGESLLDQAFINRRSLLRTNFFPRGMQDAQTIMARFDFVESCESGEGRTAIEEFMLRAIENGCEGLMIKLMDHNKTTEETTSTKEKRLKSLPATYEPDIRTSGWLKLKKDYVDGMSDSLDLIPVGGWHGNGRKARWWSPVLLALWDPEIGRPVAVCKCMSGFTDAFYTSMKERYSLESDLCSKAPIWECDFGGFKPDVYFKPNEVWEIRGADVTESPVSSAARDKVLNGRGLSLRFPRFIRSREDKIIELANTPSLLVRIWKSQQGRNDDGNDDGDLVDIEAERCDGTDNESDELEP